MRWERGHVSRDVIDRRGSGGGGGIGGLFALMPFLIRSPLGWIGALVLIGGYFLLGGVGGGGRAPNRAAEHQSPGAAPQGQADEAVQFVSFVLDDAQGAWEKKFADAGKTYRHAKLVLFTNSTPSGCGYGSAASGPFYCPQDERVYIDLGFYHELEERFGAPGDFAQAYVIAHEIGHHVQKLLGTSDRVHAASSREQGGAQGLSVRLELQADCYAGIWAHSTERRDILEKGDIEEALRAAAAIGDDRLQRQSTGTVHPETWTHGSSEQRSRWFRRGYDAGNPNDCDTFETQTL